MPVFTLALAGSLLDAPRYATSHINCLWVTTSNLTIWYALDSMWVAMQRNRTSNLLQLPKTHHSSYIMWNYLLRAVVNSIVFAANLDLQTARYLLVASLKTWYVRFGKQWLCGCTNNRPYNFPDKYLVIATIIIKFARQHLDQLIIINQTHLL